MDECKTITMWDVEQFARLIAENGGKYIFANFIGVNEDGSRNIRRYPRGAEDFNFDALIQLEKFGPVLVKLDMRRYIPWPYQLENIRTGELTFETTTKSELVQALSAAGVKPEHIKPLKKVTLKELVQVTDCSETEPKVGNEDNFELLLKSSTNKNTVQFDSSFGKLTFRAEKQLCNRLLFHLSIDWKEEMERVIAEARAIIEKAGLKVQNGVIQ